MVKDVALVMVGAGFLVQVYAFWETYHLRHDLKTGRIKEAWDLLAAFIVAFMLGYLGYAAHLFFDAITLPSHFITASMFLLGAVFVAATARVNRNAFRVD